MSAFSKVDTLQGDYFVHCCPACRKPPEFVNCGSDGQILFCPTKGHEHKFSVDTPKIKQTVDEWNQRCTNYIVTKNFKKMEEQP